jgi:hypothetical protein
VRGQPLQVLLDHSAHQVDRSAAGNPASRAIVVGGRGSGCVEGRDESACGCISAQRTGALRSLRRRMGRVLGGIVAARPVTFQGTCKFEGRRPRCELLGDPDCLLRGLKAPCTLGSVTPSCQHRKNSAGAPAGKARQGSRRQALQLRHKRCSGQQSLRSVSIDHE